MYFCLFNSKHLYKIFLTNHSSRFLPESFRWLIAQKRFDKAEAVVTKIVKFNDLEFPRDIFDDVVEKNKTEEKNPASNKYTIIDLFRFRVLRKRSVILAWIW